MCLVTSAGDPELLRFIDAYRIHGHLKACLDPLGLARYEDTHVSLDPLHYGLTTGSRNFSGLQELLPAFACENGSLSEVVCYLQHMYCGNISLEAAHVPVRREGFVEVFL